MLNSKPGTCCWLALQLEGSVTSAKGVVLDCSTGPSGSQQHLLLSPTHHALATGRDQRTRSTILDSLGVHGKELARDCSALCCVSSGKAGSASSGLC